MTHPLAIVIHGGCWLAKLGNRAASARRTTGLLHGSDVRDTRGTLRGGHEEGGRQSDVWPDDRRRSPALAMSD